MRSFAEYLEQSATPRKYQKPVIATIERLKNSSRAMSQFEEATGKKLSDFPDSSVIVWNEDTSTEKISFGIVNLNDDGTVTTAMDLEDAYTQDLSFFSYEYSTFELQLDKSI
ncbi:hypothetical protein [Companilactobacillus metriopterae]|uniref:hypothetical protein n=1 Tax=Companilactobacillus metriopterae TaxID=1909267 RepID=UPI00100C19BC|nr:hypothetical protein [Companilactobacillus metriopterae]